ncbi:SigE family RNA polymerase sigma factor [Actinoplanes sp. CA-054009]
MPDSDFTAYFTGRVGSVRRLAFALCGDWHTADDLVQATFVKLYPRWRRVRGGEIDAYVRRILVNTYLTHLRKHRRETVVAAVPDAAAPAPEIPDDLGQALRQLPAQQRAVVVLRHLEDLPIAEVAALLDIAEGTVKSQSARGIAALRTAIQAQRKEVR